MIDELLVRIFINPWTVFLLWNLVSAQARQMSGRIQEPSQIK